MKHMRFFGAIALVFTASLASAEQYKVEKSLTIDRSADELWHMVGDFCDIDDWHPAINGCSLKVIDGGLHRILTVGDGEFVEKLIAVEPGLSYTYRIVSSPLPLDKYVGTLAITRGDSATLTWSSRFSSDDPAMEKLIGDIYTSGLEAIKAEVSP